MRQVELPADAKRIVPAPGQVPELGWLPISSLVIDDAYQRDITKDSWKRVYRIAEAFAWSRFSPVLVAQLAADRYAIIDGQHRTHAAAMCGLTQVPCLILHMTIEEQAASFAAVNGMVTRVTGFQILKAALIARERWAVAASMVCASAGCTLMTQYNVAADRQPGEIYPIALIRKLVADKRGEYVTTGLRALRNSVFGEKIEAYANEVLKPLFIALIERPDTIEPGYNLVGLVDRFDWHGALDRAGDFVKAQRRAGLQGVASFEVMSKEIIAAIDGKPAPTVVLAKPPPEPPAAVAPELIGTRATAPNTHRDVLPARAPIAAPSPRPKHIPTPPGTPQPSGERLPADARVRVRRREGGYRNKFGTGWTTSKDNAWTTTKDRAEIAIRTKPDLKGCVMESADD